MGQKVYFNGEIKEAGEACVSVSDGGFLYGAGLFETMRSRGGKVFAIEDHIDRMFGSAAKLNIPCAMDKDGLIEAISETLKANELGDARIRLTISSGSMGGEDERRGTILITATGFEAYPQEYYKKGIRAVLSPCRQNTTDPTTGHKSTSYFPRLMMLDHARRKGALEALWFTFEGLLAEGCISNVFLVKNGILLTPALGTPVLGGIVRKHLLGVADDNGIEVSECDLTINDLLSAEEVFVTNSIMHIMPVSAVEAHNVGEAKPGEITTKLMAAFAEYFQEKTA